MAGVGDVVGGDTRPGPHRRPNRLALSQFGVSASAPLVVCRRYAKERKRPLRSDDIGNVILLRIIGKGPSTARVMAPCYRNGDDESMSGQDSEETTSEKQESDTRDERDTMAMKTNSIRMRISS